MKPYTRIFTVLLIACASQVSKYDAIADTIRDQLVLDEKGQLNSNLTNVSIVLNYGNGCYELCKTKCFKQGCKIYHEEVPSFSCDSFKTLWDSIYVHLKRDGTTTIREQEAYTISNYENDLIKLSQLCSKIEFGEYNFKEHPIIKGTVSEKVVGENGEPMVAGTSAASAAMTVSGTILDENNEPLIGAAVVVIGDTTKYGTSTDIDGNFEIKNVPTNAQIEISMLGYKTETVVPATKMSIKMNVDASTIESAVVSSSIKDGDKCADKTAHIQNGVYKKSNGTWVCVPNENGCELGYKVIDKQCVEITSETEKCDDTYAPFIDTSYECLYLPQTTYNRDSCFIANFVLIDGLNKDIKKENEEDFNNWKNSCKSLGDCKHAAQMDWTSEKNGKYTTYTCVPKTCLNTHPTKTADGCLALEDGADCKPLDTNAASGKYNAKTQKCESTTCKNPEKFEVKDGVCISKTLAAPEKIDTRTQEEREKALADKQKAYDDAKAKENSTENKALTALSTAATGIGGMELLRGLSEQNADKKAAADMEQYITSMKCSYGRDNFIDAGLEEKTLDGGNDETMMKLRDEYLQTVIKLKGTKQALGMMPGIENEIQANTMEEISKELTDKKIALYNQENTGITESRYGSLYLANMYNSESDKEKIDADKKASKNRVIAGGVIAGAGVVGGVVGNSLINGKLGEKIKELKDKNASTKENNSTIEALKRGLKDAGMKNTDKLDLSNFDISALKDMVSATDFTKLNLSDKDATKDIQISNQTSLASSLESLLKQ